MPTWYEGSDQQTPNIKIMTSPNQMLTALLLQQKYILVSCRIENAAQIYPV
jgi:hypothetical protein